MADLTDETSFHTSLHFCLNLICLDERRIVHHRTSWVCPPYCCCGPKTRWEQEPITVSGDLDVENNYKHPDKRAAVKTRVEGIGLLSCSMLKSLGTGFFKFADNSCKKAKI